MPPDSITVNNNMNLGLTFLTVSSPVTQPHYCAFTSPLLVCHLFITRPILGIVYCILDSFPLTNSFVYFDAKITFSFFFYFASFFFPVGGHMCAMAHMWSSEDIYMELVLSVYLHVGSGDQTQMVGTFIL